MQVRKLFRSVLPFISALATVATATVLILAIYFTQIGPQWITFLAGVLVAATLAETTRRSYAEWVVIRRTSQLSALKTRYEHELQLRRAAEKEVAAAKPRLNLIDEVLPTMVAFMDQEGVCRYFNRAFINGLQLRPDQVDGRHMRDILGATVYRETATEIRKAMEGHAVKYERTQKMQDDAIYRLSVENLPQFGPDDKVTGFFMLMNDITEPTDVHMPAQLEPSVEQHMFVDSYAEQVTGQHDAGLLRMAIEKGEFILFCQLIKPLPMNSGEAVHYEILVRLMEEEEIMIPPGMFFPLAEKYGLMTHLDRWVVQHVAEWIARSNPQAGQKGSSIYFINLSEATIADPGFPEFLQLTLNEYGVPGATLCFEITDSDLASRTEAVAEFARQVSRHGCHVALSGFGRDRVLFNLIRGFRVDFLKIDGSVILDILHDPVKQAKVTAIDKVAKKIGVKTIAELVESEEIIVALRGIGIDFVQGYGISRPRPLAE